MTAEWQFWVDRGGTFTDIVAHSPKGELLARKFLSENPARYADAAVHGIHSILQEHKAEPDTPIEIRMGTTVGTNALLERQGARVGLAITEGLADALHIGYQNRPDIFALDIHLPSPLYHAAIEVPERLSAKGEIIVPLQTEILRSRLQSLLSQGCTSLAIVLLHADRHPQHEIAVYELARTMGFTHISMSHRTRSAIRLIRRGDTTVMDAYLSPVLQHYVQQVRDGLGEYHRLFFMQSNGGLVRATAFQGRDCVLSGPAGGIIGAVKTACAAGFNRLISFDMGGTSTDVAHYAGELERSYEHEIAGARLSVPMLDIHTVAAGGGSILHFDGLRYRVGPDSAGANPGPAAYRLGGPLTVTDCNVMLGRIQPQHFPALFGPEGNQALDKAEVTRLFTRLAADVAAATSQPRTIEQVAEDFLDIAVHNMASAIHRISVARGRDLSGYTLVCFGGAGGQHACRVATQLGLRTILLHPFAGVLSALGIGLAEQRSLHSLSLERVWDADLAAALDCHFADHEARHVRDNEGKSHTLRRLHVRYAGTDTSLPVPYPCSDLIEVFNRLYQQRYGYCYPERQLVISSIETEQVLAAPVQLAAAPMPEFPAQPQEQVEIYLHGQWHRVPVYQRSELALGQCINGPALVLEATGTNVIESGWQACMHASGNLLLQATGVKRDQVCAEGPPDPKYLEIFMHRFMAIAEEMGSVLQQTASSVNIKERLDFSCAVFNGRGELIANAPHIPVHLGSMSDSVQSIMQRFGDSMQPGDAFLLNCPYAGGTHLPDMTVVSPVFVDGHTLPAFFVAARGHHADIGGSTPGSMPAFSNHIDEEGARSDGMRIVQQHRLLEQEIRDWLMNQPEPARKPEQNIADLAAQLAANNRGIAALQQLVQDYSLATVQAYMDHALNLAEERMRQALLRQQDGSFTNVFDDGSQIQVDIRINRSTRSAYIDFSGSSGQQPNNFNAPAAVTRAAVLYVFRTLIAEDLPLNAGCLRPLTLHIPAGCLLNPVYPAAVVAGNVETSQHIVDALYGALGVLAASQGTMNNLTFGDDRYQYYETICGGAGASLHADGASAVQTHMTNSRLTDPEILELRFPVRLQRFAIRHGSGGKGLHRGGDGVERAIQFLHPMTATLLSSHRKTPPFGLQGGEPGQCGENAIRRANGSVEHLAGVAQMRLQEGDTLIVMTPGGGGFGQAPIQHD